MSGCRKCAAMACRFATMVTGTTGSPTTRATTCRRWPPSSTSSAGSRRTGLATPSVGWCWRRDWAGATWTRRGSLPWRCSVARSAPRTGCSGCPWQASSRACCCAASMRCPEAVGGRGRKTSRSAWRWRSCVGMGCSAASASRATTGGRGSPQSTYRYWRSPGLGTGRTRPGPVASCSSSSPRPSANTCCSDTRLATPRTTGISRC